MANFKQMLARVHAKGWHGKEAETEAHKRLAQSRQSKASNASTPANTGKPKAKAKAQPQQSKQSSAKPQPRRAPGQSNATTAPAGQGQRQRPYFGLRHSLPTRLDCLQSTYRGRLTFGVNDGWGAQYQEFMFYPNACFAKTRAINGMVPFLFKMDRSGWSTSAALGTVDLSYPLAQTETTFVSGAACQVMPTLPPGRVRLCGARAVLTLRILSGATVQVNWRKMDIISLATRSKADIFTGQPEMGDIPPNKQWQSREFGEGIHTLTFRPPMVNETQYGGWGLQDTEPNADSAVEPEQGAWAGPTFITVRLVTVAPSTMAAQTAVGNFSIDARMAVQTELAEAQRHLASPPPTHTIVETLEAIANGRRSACEAALDASTA